MKSLLVILLTFLSPNADIFLLTCTPGTEAWAKFGHTAIYVQDTENQIDAVFNYGIFSFNTDHFYAKFVRGETYYCLGVESYDQFVFGNAYIGRKTYSQHLNLTPEQKENIYCALLENYRPENRYYLYNFVYDNCATRPLKLIENSEALPRQSAACQPQNYRDLISHYAGPNTWLTFGINLIFGKDADQQITTYETLFLPEQLANYITTSGITDTPQLPDFQIDTPPFFASANVFYLLIILLTILALFLEYKTHKRQWWFDALCYGCYGILGLIACYLSFFSIHPLVKHNWNELILNPFMLIPFVLLLIPRARAWYIKYERYVVFALFLLLVIRIFSFQTWHPFLWLPILQIVYPRPHINMLKFSKSKSLLLTALCLLPLASYAEKPTLTVMIQVNGLSYEAMQELRPYWRQGGLRTLDEEAREIQVTYPFMVHGGVETTVSLLTGTQPRDNGIAGNTFFNRQDRQSHPIFEDPNADGIATTQHLSPASILSPTLTDLFRLRYGSAARIYALGVDAASTIALAGHAANAVAWIEPQQMQWATTTYYNEGLPAEADKSNVNSSWQELQNKTWQPSMDKSAYLHTTPKEKKNGFSYPVNKHLVNSPYANKFVIDLALAMQREKKLGTNLTPDLLLLSLTTITPAAASDKLECAEQEDIYLALNQELGYLMEQLDHQLGSDKYQIILFGTPRFGMSQKALKTANLESKVFNIERAAALLNTYLMAIYGHERWVDGGAGHSIYLNHTILEQKKISVSEIEEQICHFLIEFAGVKAAYTYEQLYSLNTPNAALLCGSQIKQQMGDVILELQPLWRTAENAPIFLTPPTTPLFIYTKQRTTVPTTNASSTELLNILLELL